MTTDGAGTGCPAQMDMARFLDDSRGEERRCLAQHWWARSTDLSGGHMPVVLGWAANREALGDRRLSPKSFADDMVASGLSVETAFQVAPLFGLHGDEHRRTRAVLSSAFTPRKVERLRPEARSIAERLAAEIEGRGGSCEFVADFAAPLAPEVFAILFGLPREDRDRLARWASDIALAFSMFMTPDQVATVEAAAAEMRDYGRERIEVSRADPGDDLVTRLVEAEVDGHRLDDREVIAMITGFVFAGAETTRRQLTAAVQVLADHPADWGRLAREPELVAGAVEEVMRFRPIVPGLTRRAEEDFEQGDLELEAGGRLLLAFTAANHDESRFDHPDRFVVDRPDAHAHVTFGWGPHLCVGAGLARLEMTEALSVLTQRFGPPTVEAEGPTSGLLAPDWLEVTFPPR